jgi:D-alanyl-D-alanine carboxypeptidase
VYKPPADDEPRNSDEHEEEGNEDSSPTYPRLRAAARKAAANRGFHSDEHPEIPKIRRASLKSTRIEVLPASKHGLDDEQTGHRPSQSETEPQARLKAKAQRAEMHPFTGLEEDEDAPATGAQPRVVHRRKQAEMRPFTGLEREYERDIDTDKREKVSRRKRTPYKAPRQTSGIPSVAAPASRRRVRRTSRVSAPFFGRRQSWLLIGLLALLVLVVAPILVGISHNLSTPQSNSSSGNTSNISISQLQSVPSNPHELVIMPPQTDHPAPPVLATSAYLLNADSETTLYAQNPFLHLPMLSTTKLMTASLAVQLGNLDQQITITSAMENDIHQLSADSAIFGVKLGETYSLRDLLYGLLYVSGNDAALIIADALAGNVPAFVAKMNQKAQELGLHDTHYVNPHGLLNAGQYSCARDLAVLGQYSLNIPELQQISGGRTYHIPAGGKHGERILLNENQFLWWYPGVTGGKTGYDGLQDFVQVMQVTRNKHHMIGVVMHTNDWWTDMRDMMDYGSGDYTWNSPRNVDLSGQPIPYDNLWNYFVKDTQDANISLANNGRYYVYSGYSLTGDILAYFDQKGGLKTFGFPLKMPVPDGSILIRQQFEHGSIVCDLSNNACRTA